MTNYEKIKQMSVEEMAEKLPCPYNEYYLDCNKDCDCKKCCKEWLESEVEE